MKHMKRLAIYTLSMFALGTIGVTAAQAEKIEWGVCYEVPTHWGGKYSDSGCTKEAVHKSGAYEWASRKPESVEVLDMRTEGAVAFETAAGEKITCSKISSHNITYLPYKDAESTTPHWWFEGCESEGQPCRSTNQANLSGEIDNLPAWYERNSWAFKLGFVSDAEPANPVVGLQYTVQNKGEFLFEPISCEGEQGKAFNMRIGAAKGKASWIATIGPVNTMTHELTETYSESAPGVQSPAGFEGKKAGHLENWVPGEQHWEPVAIVATFQDEAEGDIEIKATR